MVYKLQFTIEAINYRTVPMTECKPNYEMFNQNQQCYCVLRVDKWDPRKDHFAVGQIDVFERRTAMRICFEIGFNNSHEYYSVQSTVGRASHLRF